MTHTPLYGAFLLTISMKTRIPKKSITVCSMLPAASFCSCGWGCGHGEDNGSAPPEKRLRWARLHRTLPF